MILLILLSIKPLVFSQKISEDKFWTNFTKSPNITLTPTYQTYSIEYDFGNMAVKVGDPPKVQGLEFKKNDADLLLKIYVKGIYVENKKLNETKARNGMRYYYSLSYKAEYGYDLVENKTGKTIYSFERAGGPYDTRDFESRSDLETYMQNALIGDLTKALLSYTQKKVDYDLSEHNYEVRLAASKIEGESDAYKDINKATEEFKNAISGKKISKGTPAPYIQVWEKHLSKADWGNKKSQINKKVANALINNLCAAYLLMEDYTNMKEKSSLFEKNNSGILASLTASPSFEIDGSYTGPSSGYHTIIKNSRPVNVYTPTFIEFSSDLIEK